MVVDETALLGVEHQPLAALAVARPFRGPHVGLLHKGGVGVALDPAGGFRLERVAVDLLGAARAEQDGTGQQTGAGHPQGRQQTAPAAEKA